jgi:hypothetical protein
MTKINIICENCGTSMNDTDLYRLIVQYQSYRERTTIIEESQICLDCYYIHKIWRNRVGLGDDRMKIVRDYDNKIINIIFS